MRIEYHRALIADQVRNAAFKAALSRVIRPGTTVVADIGAGTGLIGLMAARLGAREVHLYEMAEVAAVASAILARNRVRNCHLMPCHSREARHPPRADVIVSETLGNYPLEENIIETLNDALRRHLVPGGVVIPGRLAQYAAPVVDGRIHAELTAWERADPDIDLSPAQTMSLNNIYVRAITPRDLLDDGGSARCWDEIDFSRTNRSTRKGQAHWPLARDAIVFGFASWWSAELVPGITLSTAPDAPRTHWDQLYLPLLRPISGRAGDTISICLRSRSSEQAGTDIAWTAVTADRAGRLRDRQAMALSRGYLP